MIRAGETYTRDRNLTKAEALGDWFGYDKESSVTADAGPILGTYAPRTNQAGGGAHVCDCGYMPATGATGASIARAVRLWQAMGFATVGRLPAAFHHPSLGDVDALVMFRPL